MMKSTTILLLACLLMLACGQNKEADAQPVDATQQTEDALPETESATPEAEAEEPAPPCEAVDVSAQIVAVNKEIMLTYEDKDAAALANYFTDDAQAYQPNAPIVEGKENIRDFWQAMIDVGIHHIELHTNTAVGMGHTAQETGISRLYLEDNTLVDEAKYVVLWRKVNGRWKVQTDIWNSNMPCVPVEETTE